MSRLYAAIQLLRYLFFVHCLVEVNIITLCIGRGLDLFHYGFDFFMIQMNQPSNEHLESENPVRVRPALKQTLCLIDELIHYLFHDFEVVGIL